MTDNPVLDAERYNDALDNAADAAEAKSIETAKNLKTDFMHFALRDMKVPATFDKPYQAQNPITKERYIRHSTVSEVMYEALDLGDGPSTDDVFQFLGDAARNGNKLALTLIERMAAKWAEVNAA